MVLPFAFPLSGDYLTALIGLFSPNSSIFGEKIKEDVLAPYRSANNSIPGDDDQIADIFIRERCFWLGIMMGKHFPLVLHPEPVSKA